VSCSEEQVDVTNFAICSIIPLYSYNSIFYGLSDGFRYSNSCLLYPKEHSNGSRKIVVAKFQDVPSVESDNVVLEIRSQHHA